MKKSLKMLSAVLAATMVIATPVLPAMAEDTSAADLEATKKAITATVTADAQIGGAYALAPETFTVNAYEAESYGYTDTLDDSVSTLDVLVAETEKMFGTDFTKDSASTYLAVSDGGWITTIFGEATGSCGFYLNDAMTSTLINETPVADGDTLTYFIYQDQTYWTDKYVTFAEGKELSAGTDLNVTVTVQSADWYGNMSAVEEASVGYLTDEGIKEIGSTDENGKITFKAPDTAGAYTIVAYGEDVTASPIVMNTLKLNVTDQNEYVAELLKTIEEKKAEVEDLTAKNETANENLEKANEELSATKEELATAKTELETAKTENKTAKTELATAQAASKTTQTELATAKKELATAKKELAAAKLALAKTKAKYATVSGLKVTSKSKKLTVTWKKNSAVTGYQVSYKLKTAKSYSTLKTTTTLKAVSKALKKGKKYQVKVRPYTKVNGTKVYGKYTSVKTVTCK